MKWRSSVSSSLKRHVLLRGSVIATMGALFILFSGMFVPANKMAFWGLPIFALGFGIITWGLRPYRRLCRLENNPRELVLTGDETLEFFTNGNKIVTIPMCSIEAMTHVDKADDYGIGIKLKKSPKQKIVIHDRKLQGICSGKDATERYACDLYFRFFSRRTFEQLAVFTESICFLELSPKGPIVYTFFS